MRLLLLCLAFCFVTQATAQSTLSGKITDEKGEALPFASVFVKDTRLGTSSNQEGRYELSLQNGTYEIIFQFLGYATQSHQIQIEGKNKVLNIKLESQSLRLPNLEIGTRKEDPAYPIMRKVIARAKYHRMVVKGYKTRVYVKGSIDLQKVPALAKPLLKREGVDPDKTLTIESVTDVTYQHPDRYIEEVKSFRTTFKQMDQPPSFFIGSFYENEVNGVKSPLAQNAFSFYKYTFEGYYQDQGYWINKIKVVPRRKGVNLVSGHIYIIEDLWALHSVDLEAKVNGGDVKSRQIYTPIESDIWMPTTQRYKVKQKVFGFEVEFLYATSTKGFDLELDHALIRQMREANAIEFPSDQEEKAVLEEELMVQETEKEEPEDQPMSNKELKKMLRDFEKERVKDLDNPRVVSERHIKMDSLASKRDLSYWNEVRTIPLTEKELKTIQVLDSAQVKEERDSVKNNRFRWSAPLTGSYTKLNERWTLDLKSIPGASGFNTVEGWYLSSKATIFTPVKPGEKQNRYYLHPDIRYAFASRRFTAKFSGRAHFSEHNHDFIGIRAGRYVEQFNEQEPISFFLNTLSTLLLQENWIRLYEQDFVQIEGGKKLADGLTISSRLGYAHRRPLENQSNFTLINRRDREYMENTPENLQEANTDFPAHELLKFEAKVSYKPWLKYRIYNNRQIELRSSSPEFTLLYQGGKGLNNTVQFSHLQGGFNWRKKMGIMGDLHTHAKTGFFSGRPEAGEIYFMDFHHFDGNLTYLQEGDFASKFRTLDYYQFSTAQEYLELHALQEFRQLLLTQIAYFQLAGINEALFAHYLWTPQGQFAEVGYALNNILNLFRLEVATSLPSWQYGGTRFRIGVSSLFN